MLAFDALWSRLVSLFGRREHARLPSNLTVDWHLFGSQVGHISALRDLSPGGAFVRAAYPREVGSPIVLELPTPQGRVNVHARVAWCGRNGMGLRFTRPVQDGRMAFTAL